MSIQEVYNNYISRGHPVNSLVNFSHKTGNGNPEFRFVYENQKLSCICSLSNSSDIEVTAFGKSKKEAKLLASLEMIERLKKYAVDNRLKFVPDLNTFILH